MKKGLFKEGKPLKKEEYRLLQEERSNKEKRLIYNKMAVARQRVQEFESMEIPE
nr:hypothetical protein [Chlamydia pneumoniae]